jgi:hypothetical protein
LKHTVFIVLIILFISNDFLAQNQPENDKEIDSIIEELIFSDTESLLSYIQQVNKYQVLFASFGFNNKTYFLGRDLGLDQYNLSSQLYYQHSNGFFIGVSGVYYSKFNPKWDLTTLTSGYGHNFGNHKNFKYELSYSRYIFSDETSNDFENSLDVSLSAETNDGYLGISSDMSYFFGKKQGFQTSFDVYSEFDLFRINDNTKVTFNPLLTFQLGSESIDTSRIEDLLTDVPPLILEIANSFEQFKLRNIQLQIPFTLESGNFYFQSGYNFNFPNALRFENNLKNSSFFNLRLSYIFDLK